MTNRQVLGLVAAIWIAALFPTRPSAAIVAALAIVAAVALVVRRPALLLICVVAAASLRSGAAWDRVAASPPISSYTGPAVLVGDPEPVSGGVRVDIAIEDIRLELRAWGSPAGWLRPRLRGDTVEIDATVRPLGPGSHWQRTRGITGRATATSVSGHEPGSIPSRIANAARTTIETGARSMSRPERALYVGLVYGDDRAHSPLLADNFAGSGLTHLVAVSGQNVAFVLALFGPLLRRLRYQGRFITVLAVIGLFAVMTRFEPSVIRASAMAATAALGALVGTAVSSARLLAIAVGALVLFDPLLVHRVGFQLSVVAAGGILAWSARIALAVPGPRPVIEAVAVTAAAQIAVAPILIWRFGGVPVASLPANLLAGPVAGPIMVWGLTGGIVAGAVPDPVAAVLHLPTRLGLWWLTSTAQWCAMMPLGELGPVTVGGCGVGGWMGLRSERRSVRLVGVAMVVAALLAPAALAMAETPTSHPIDAESTIWRDPNRVVVEIDPGSRPAEVLEALRRDGVGQIDLVVVRRASYAAADLVGWIAERHRVVQVWAPARTMGRGEVIPAPGTEIVVDGRVLVAELRAEPGDPATLSLRPGPKTTAPG